MGEWVGASVVMVVVVCIGITSMGGDVVPQEARFAWSGVTVGANLCLVLLLLIGSMSEGCKIIIYNY